MITSIVESSVVGMERMCLLANGCEEGNVVVEGGGCEMRSNQSAKEERERITQQVNK